MVRFIKFTLLMRSELHIFRVKVTVLTIDFALPDMLVQCFNPMVILIQYKEGIITTVMKFVILVFNLGNL
ncbi:MAG TPA: hypothetical protein DEB31_07595 [Clostridiales bacterium]|nr:hypothetical protein [Clostridiales bacterium]